MNLNVPIADCLAPSPNQTPHKTDLIDESCPLLFLIATTGNGTFPTSASTFWRFLLRRDLPADILGDLRCSIFGLGDSTYAKFCWPARLLRRRLASLGAETEFSKGEDADEQHLLGIEGALQPFLEAFWVRLEEWQPREKGVEEIPEDQLLPPRYEVRFVPEPEAEVAATASSSSRTLRQRYGIARLTRNERMTAKDHFQDVRLLEFADTRRSVQLPDDFARAGPSRLPMTAGAGAEKKQENGHAGDAEEDADAGPGEMRYDAGDVMCVKPENSEAHVERFLQRMGWAKDRERLVHIASRSSGELAIHRQCPRRKFVGHAAHAFSLIFHLIFHIAPLFAHQRQPVPFRQTCPRR